MHFIKKRRDVLGHTITIEKKKVFLQHFMERYQPKQYESLWILHYIANHELLLNKVHFVEMAKKALRSMTISTVDSTEVPFVYYKEYKAFTNPEQAFHDMRLNWEQDMYIELHFPDAWRDSLYLSVLEDNPFYPWNENVSDEVSAEAAEGMDALLYEIYHERIELAIEQAIDRNDEAAFKKHSYYLNFLYENFQHGGKA